jgi:hypothetical protein
LNEFSDAYKIFKGNYADMRKVVRNVEQEAQAKWLEDNPMLMIDSYKNLGNQARGTRMPITPEYTGQEYTGTGQEYTEHMTTEEEDQWNIEFDRQAAERLNEERRLQGLPVESITSGTPYYPPGFTPSVTPTSPYYPPGFTPSGTPTGTPSGTPTPSYTDVNPMEYAPSTPQGTPPTPSYTDVNPMEYAPITPQGTPPTPSYTDVNPMEYAPSTPQGTPPTPSYDVVNPLSR